MQGNISFFIALMGQSSNPQKGHMTELQSLTSHKRKTLPKNIYATGIGLRDDKIMHKVIQIFTRNEQINKLT